MGLHETLFYALIAIILAMLARPLQDRTHLPFPIFLIVIGFVLSESYIALGYDTGVRASNFHALSQNLFIPIILFTSAFSMSPSLVFKHGVIHFLFALPITLITILVTATLLYFGINHPTGFPWLAAFLTASILAATGAHAIESYLSHLKIASRLIHILQIESLFTAILAVLFYNFFSNMILMPKDISYFFWFFDFVMNIIGGIFIGIILSYVILGALKFAKESMAQAIILIAGVYAGYVLCEIWGVSGAFAVFTLGIFLGNFCRNKTFGDQHFTGKLFDALYLLAISGLFLLVGTTITWSMFEERWLAMLIGIFAVILARAFSIYVGLTVYNTYKGHWHYNTEDQTILVLSGVRAALPIALAFGIPVQVDYWWTIQSIVFGVVLFGLFFQAPVLRWFSKHRRHHEN